VEERPRRERSIGDVIRLSRTHQRTLF
jgi:hypothetical protein